MSAWWLIPWLVVIVGYFGLVEIRVEFFARNPVIARACNKSDN